MSIQIFNGIGRESKATSKANVKTVSGNYSNNNNPYDFEVRTLISADEIKRLGDLGVSAMINGVLKNNINSVGSDLLFKIDLVYMPYTGGTIFDEKIVNVIHTIRTEGTGSCQIYTESYNKGISFKNSGKYLKFIRSSVTVDGLCSPRNVGNFDIKYIE